MRHYLLIFNLLDRQQETTQYTESMRFIWCTAVQSGCETPPEGGRQIAHMLPCPACKSRVTVATLIAVWSAFAKSSLSRFAYCVNRILAHNSVLFRRLHILVCHIARHRCAGYVRLSWQYGQGWVR